jgi:[protein-PII] uridylyltransferase
LKAEARLYGGKGEHTASQRSEQLQTLCDPSFDQRSLANFVATMPERYLRSSQPAEIVAHAKLAYAQVQHGCAAIVPSRHGEATELCVVAGTASAPVANLAVFAQDRPGLLAAIAAVLSANRLEVDAAEIHTRSLPGGGIQAVDLFWVRDRIRGPAGVAATMPKLNQDLTKVLAGELDPLVLLRSRKTSRWSERPAPRVSTHVVLHAEASAHYTLIEVQTKDRPGVLFAVARALHALGITIALAKISTEGARVTDTFYVTELSGEKLDPSQRSKEVQKFLLDAMQGADANL